RELPRLRGEQAELRQAPLGLGAPAPDRRGRREGPRRDGHRLQAIRGLLPQGPAAWSLPLPSRLGLLDEVFREPGLRLRGRDAMPGTLARGHRLRLAVFA